MNSSIFDPKGGYNTYKEYYNFLKSNGIIEPFYPNPIQNCPD